MTRTLTRLSLAAAIAGLVEVPALAAPHTAKVSISEAGQIALRAYRGDQIVKQELEHDHRGSGLRNSFDMRKSKSWREVCADAMTAKVLETARKAPIPRTEGDCWAGSGGPGPTLANRSLQQSCAGPMCSRVVCQSTFGGGHMRVLVAED